MGIFDIFKKVSAKYIDEYKHQDNMKKQIAMVPELLAKLQQSGITDDSELKLEYFFYTNAEDKADRLSEKLSVLGYSTEQRPSADSNTDEEESKKLTLLTGWSNPVKMAKDKLCQWIKDMCILGFEQDCEFDGWGTKP